MMTGPMLFALLLLAQLNPSPNDVVRDAGRVGLEVDKRGGALVITSVDAGCSAEKAGVKVGDQLLRVDLEATASMSASAVNGDLRGVFGSKVKLVLLPRAAMLPRT